MERLAKRLHYERALDIVFLASRRCPVVREWLRERNNRVARYAESIARGEKIKYEHPIIDPRNFPGVRGQP